MFEKSSPSLRVVYMGNPDFAVPGLTCIYESQHTIAGVVTGHDKKRGRGNQLSPTPIKEKAVSLGLPIIQADKVKDPELWEQIEALQPDIIVIVAFKILPPEILAIPALGAINLHASLLPKYRGAAPIHWAVINGEKETGNTIFILDNGVDTGKIIHQKKITIGENETTGEIYERLMEVGGPMLVESLDMIANQSTEPVSQTNELATPAPMVFPETSLIDPDQSAINIHNFVRGLSPSPGAWCRLDGEKFKLYSTQIPKQEIPTEKGKLTITKEGVYLGCTDGVLELLEIQLQGRKRMATKEFFNGYQGDGALSFGL